MAQQIAIDDWVKGLSTIPKKDFTIERIESYLREQWIRSETLRPYLFYGRSHYTRNLIFKSDLFEVLAICWESGQASSVHNHRGQNCWMAVPIGKLRVENFRIADRDAQHGTCRSTASDSYDMDAAHPGTVRPEEPVHRVLNLPEFGQRATSIHVYSYPYASCEIYSIEQGSYCEVPLSYTSEYGTLVPGARLE